MTFTPWGPALEAEITYRHERARLAWPQRRSLLRRTRPTDPGVARPAAPAPAPAPDAGRTPPPPLHALAGGGARQRSLPGSEAWPAA